VFWVGGNDRGNGIGWRLNGYTPVRVTTHAVELAWQGYPKISDAVSYSYQFNGHAFWVVFFPSANNGNGATWAFDTASGLWHERDYLNTANGIHTAHPSWNHAFAFGTHIVGDWRSNNLYQMDERLFDNAGSPIIRLRRAPHISTELEIIKHARFVLDMETGLGPQPPLLSGGNYDSTRIQSSGGGSIDKYLYDSGVTVAARAYNVSVLVLNQGAANISITTNFSGVTTVVPGQILQFSIMATGDGVSNLFIKFRTNSFEIAGYDKMKDMEKAKISEKRALEDDNVIQMHLFDKIETTRKNKPLEVFRWEIRLNLRKKISQVQMLKIWNPSDCRN